MKYRELGKSGISVSEIGLGTWEISGDVYGSKDDADSINALNKAFDYGVNYFDTAAGYGAGHSEHLLGRFIAEKGIHPSQSIVVSTKIFPKCRKWAPPPEYNIDDFFPPEWISQQCEESLKRLGRDYVDILFLHTWSSAWAHRTEWYDEMLKLKNAGKIRAIGISISDQRIDEANVHIEGQRVDVVQCVYNIFQQEPEYNLFPLVQKYNIGIVARSPFNSGALIGNWTKDTKFSETDWRGIWPKRMGFYNWLEECVEMTEHVKYAIREVMPLSSAALKYILMHPAVSSVIPGSANPTHVEKNIAVLSMPDLPLQVIESLKNLWVERKIQGTYNGSDSFGIFQGKK